MSDCSSSSEPIDSSEIETDDSDVETASDFKFVVVEFTKRGPKGKKSVHIVCDNWISFDQKKKKIVVKYMKPPYNEEDEELIVELVKRNSKAPEDWPQYNCAIRGHAETYSRALSKLRSLESKTFAFTSDSQVEPADAAAAMELHYKQKTLQLQENQIKKLMDDPAQTKPNRKQSSKILNDFKRKDEKKNRKRIQEKFNKQANTVEGESPIETIEPSICLPKQPKSNNYPSFEMLQSYENKTFQTESDVMEKLNEISVRCDAIEKNQMEIITLLRDQTRLKMAIPIEENLSAKYNLNLPCNIPEDLDKLNQIILENKEFNEALKQSMMFAINGLTSIGKATAKLLKSCLVRELAMKLTAQRQVSGKTVIKSTPLYNLVFDILKHKFHPNINENIITSAIGDGLSNSKDWDGNRKKRS